MPKGGAGSVPLLSVMPWHMLYNGRKITGKNLRVAKKCQLDTIHCTNGHLLQITSICLSILVPLGALWVDCVNHCSAEVCAKLLTSGVPHII